MPARTAIPSRRGSSQPLAQPGGAIASDLRGPANRHGLAPRRSSTRMSPAAGSCCLPRSKTVATNSCCGALVAGPGLRPIDFFSTTQRRSRFAFSQWANATAAIDTPGRVHSSTTFALNSAPWCLRRRPAGNPLLSVHVSTYLFGGHDRWLSRQPDQDAFTGRLRSFSTCRWTGTSSGACSACD